MTRVHGKHRSARLAGVVVSLEALMVANAVTEPLPKIEIEDPDPVPPLAKPKSRRTRGRLGRIP